MYGKGDTATAAVQLDVQLELPLDQRYRQAEQYMFDLPPPREQSRAEIEAGGCPLHRVFVYGCPYCDPR